MRPKYGPIHTEIGELTLDNIQEAVDNMVTVFKWKYVPSYNPKVDIHDRFVGFGPFGIRTKKIEEKYCWNEGHNHYDEHDPSSYFDGEFFSEKSARIKTISKELLDNEYFVENRFNKYYVIAFAVNFTRFEVYSKDCEKELIDWESEEGPIAPKGIITDPEYNENPIYKLFKSYNN